MIQIKKKYGQHFLRDERIVEHMLSAVSLDHRTSIFEIGCGDGFLTRRILEHPCARLWVFEIDPEWATYVQKNISDSRLSIFIENFLDLDFSRLKPHQPWTVLANLPYQITFPILHRFYAHRALLHEGVIMVQEEVAQKIVKSGGRDFGFSSLFFQYYFEWKLLDKVPASAFLPPPKVTSRLLYFKPKADPVPIASEPEFWAFIKLCFRQPRRTLQNNLQQTHVDMSCIPDHYRILRAQQMNIADFLMIWDAIKKAE